MGAFGLSQRVRRHNLPRADLYRIPARWRASDAFNFAYKFSCARSRPVTQSYVGIRRDARINTTGRRNTCASPVSFEINSP